MAAISTVDGLVLLADILECEGADGREAIKALSRDRAGGVRSFLLQELILQFATRSPHNALLVRLGGIAVPSAVCESLHHFTIFLLYVICRV